MDPRHRSLINEAMSRLDPRGRFHPDDGPGLRVVVDELREGGEPLDHPASLFGPWKELGPEAQAFLRRTVEKDIRRTMDFFPHGELWTGFVRGGWELDRFLHERSALPRARPYLARWINRLSGGPLNARNRLWRALHAWRWEGGKGVGPADMLAALGRGPQWLLGDFTEDVEVDPRARGYWLDGPRNVVYGYQVGLDLVPTSSGICCVEANLQSGILDDQRGFHQGNPYLEGILEVARAQGARRVVWLEGHLGHLRTWMLADAARLAREAEPPIEILEDPRLPSRPPLPEGVHVPNRWRLAPGLPNNTLLVRRNDFPVGSDYVINHKEAFIRSLQGVLRETNDARVHVLPMTRVPLEVPEPEAVGLPNQVYKYPDSMAGKGVFFLRARDTEHAVALAREVDRASGEPPGLFQPYTCSRLLEGRRIYDVRAEIFISPLGFWYLSSFRREAARPLPDELQEGIVSEEGVFTSNYHTGGVLSQVGSVEEREVRDAAMVVGEALRRVLEGTFRTRTRGTPSSPLLPERQEHGP